MGLKVDVIVTHGTPGVLAAKRVTATIPIVMASAGDALGSRLVSNLAHPTGNITGLTFFNPELASKRLELIKEVVPNLRDVGVLSKHRHATANIHAVGGPQCGASLIAPIPCRAPIGISAKLFGGKGVTSLAFSSWQTSKERARIEIGSVIPFRNVNFLSSAA